MVIETSRGKEKERWLRDNIGQVRRFRFLLGQTINNPNLINIEKKIQHVNRKIDDLVEKGKGIGLSEGQIKNINLEIVKMTERGETAKTIREKLEEMI